MLFNLFNRGKKQDTQKNAQNQSTQETAASPKPTMAELVRERDEKAGRAEYAEWIRNEKRKMADASKQLLRALNWADVAAFYGVFPNDGKGLDFEEEKKLSGEPDEWKVQRKSLLAECTEALEGICTKFINAAPTVRDKDAWLCRRNLIELSELQGRLMDAEDDAQQGKILQEIKEVRKEHAQILRSQYINGPGYAEGKLDEWDEGKKENWKKQCAEARLANLKSLNDKRIVSANRGTVMRKEGDARPKPYRFTPYVPLFRKAKNEKNPTNRFCDDSLFYEGDLDFDAGYKMKSIVPLESLESPFMSCKIKELAHDSSIGTFRCEGRETDVDNGGWGKEWDAAEASVKKVYERNLKGDWICPILSRADYVTEPSWSRDKFIPLYTHVYYIPSRDCAKDILIDDVKRFSVAEYYSDCCRYYDGNLELELIDYFCHNDFRFSTEAQLKYWGIKIKWPRDPGNYSFRDMEAAYIEDENWQEKLPKNLREKLSIAMEKLKPFYTIHPRSHMILSNLPYPDTDQFLDPDGTIPVYRADRRLYWDKEKKFPVDFRGLWETIDFYVNSAAKNKGVSVYDLSEEARLSARMSAVEYFIYKTKALSKAKEAGEYEAFRHAGYVAYTLGGIREDFGEYIGPKDINAFDTYFLNRPDTPALPKKYRKKNFGSSRRTDDEEREYCKFYNEQRPKIRRKKTLDRCWNRYKAERLPYGKRNEPLTYGGDEWREFDRSFLEWLINFRAGVGAISKERAEAEINFFRKFDDGIFWEDLLKERKVGEIEIYKIWEIIDSKKAEADAAGKPLTLEEELELRVKAAREVHDEEAARIGNENNAVRLATEHAPHIAYAQAPYFNEEFKTKILWDPKFAAKAPSYTDADWEKLDTEYFDEWAREEDLRRAFRSEDWEEFKKNFMLKLQGGAESEPEVPAENTESEIKAPAENLKDGTVAATENTERTAEGQDARNEAEAAAQEAKENRMQNAENIGAEERGLGTAAAKRQDPGEPGAQEPAPGIEDELNLLKELYAWKPQSETPAPKNETVEVYSPREFKISIMRGGSVQPGEYWRTLVLPE